jgi:hypothetical protein
VNNEDCIPSEFPAGKVLSKTLRKGRMFLVGGCPEDTVATGRRLEAGLRHAGIFGEGVRD